MYMEKYKISLTADPVVLQSSETDVTLDDI